MSQKILFKEKYGAFGREQLYVKPEGQNAVVHVEPAASFSQSALSRAAQAFLPQGYPDSVSSDYFNYQLWDTVQAFCSTLTGTLSARAIMAGIGVGSADATPLAAAVTWIFKDGTGMVGSICFAWWKGTSLDSDCKKWRLVADGLNDAALCLELLLPIFADWSMLLLCLATAMKAVVGVAGGATRAAVTQHQAVRENMADVSAKDGSQERFVNLTASLAGIFLLSTVPEGWFVWVIFGLLTVIHLYANYQAVRSLTMTTLNSSRYNIILQSYLATYDVDSPETVNRQESVFIGSGLNDKQLCGFRITLGASMNSSTTKNKATYEEMKTLQKNVGDEKYILIPDFVTRTINVVFKSKEDAHDVIKAYFHSVILGIMCIGNETPLSTQPVYSKEHATNNTGLLGKICHSSQPPRNTDLLTHLTQSSFEKTQQEFSKFLNALHVEGWTTSSHHMELDEWRAEWTISQ